ncbi:MAG: DUF1566 domain-containing protein [Burkholderiales bacterium]|nr:DUF1566 domain-containing protein [Burkholderiales bacterium]
MPFPFHRIHSSIRLACAALAATALPAHAALVALGGGLVQDTDRHISWAGDANLLATMRGADSGLIDAIKALSPTITAGGQTHTLVDGDFSAAGASSRFFGLASWWGALAFVSYVNHTTGLGGYHDWRLPASLQPDASCEFDRTGGAYPLSSGHHCRGSELGHLFYDELGGSDDVSIASSHNASFDLFSHVFTDYWTGTPSPTPGGAWYFVTDNGIQTLGASELTSYVWLVRDDTVTTEAPAPGSLGLALGGLLLMSALRRARR